MAKCPGDDIQEKEDETIILDVDADLFEVRIISEEPYLRRAHDERTKPDDPSYLRFS